MYISNYFGTITLNLKDKNGNNIVLRAGRHYYHHDVAEILLANQAIWSMHEAGTIFIEAAKISNVDEFPVDQSAKRKIKKSK